jgi:copper(I)-binding protein
VTEPAQEPISRPAAGRQGVTRRGLRITLGLLWLLDGALQLQPFMFGPGFAGDELAPAGDGQPGWVAAGVHWAAGLVGAHPAPWNTLFAVVQLALGVGLLVRPLVRIALVASVGWALAVWYLGEGLGGLAGGHASLITGAPGAVLLYALLAFVVWPRPVDDAPTGWRGWLRHDSSGPLPAWTPIAWAVVWIGGALLQALPGQHTADDIADSITGDDMPGWQMGLNQAIANTVRQWGGTAVWLLLAVLVAIGLGALGGPRLRAVAGWAGAVVAVVFWMVGQGFGDLASGQATDPNTGPLLIVLALAVLAVRPSPVAVSEDEPEPTRTPAWRVPAMSGLTAAVIVGVGLVQWATTQQPAGPPPHLAVTAVYTPVGGGTDAPVYFTLTNSGAGPDTLTSAGTEFQTAKAARGVTVCANEACTGDHSVTVPGHSTTVFGPAGPHLLVQGLGRLDAKHQPLQLTLTFTSSGLVHVLSPIGSPANLTMDDVMTYGYMGHRDPGMNMGSEDMSGMDMPGMTGMDMPTGRQGAPATTSGPPGTPGMTDMPGMTMDNG